MKIHRIIPVGRATNPGLSAGQTKNYDVTKGGNTSCGSDYDDVNIVFKNGSGLPIYELRARFHCGQCQKAVDQGH